jgi:dTDP-4-amino-4,6-dideoxygalactose transaminase
MYVTKPFLPPLDEFLPFLQEIWASGQIANNGAMHLRLEEELAQYLGVEHLSLFNNGTIALLAALKLYGLSGEVITTPYTFVATSHALMWNNIKPIFVDIDPLTFNLDVRAVERAITPRTTAIMPVHVYGQPCDASAFAELAEKYGLKIIYDAAHAFGVRDGGGSVLRHGDASALSFHATKVFHTFEGGALVLPSAEAKRRIDQIKNFGFTDEVSVDSVGINGKMNEVQAAMGLLHLQYMPHVLDARRAIAEHYVAGLDGVEGIFLPEIARHSQNYSYFPILIDAEFGCDRDSLYDALRGQGIFARRYFYPLATDFAAYAGHSDADMPVATRISNSVICLPIYPDMTHSDAARVIKVIQSLK